MIPHAAVTAAARQKVQRTLMDRLRAARAVDPAHPLAIGGANAAETRELQVLLDAGVFHHAGERRYYLDERRFEDWEAQQWRRARLVLLAVIVGAICLLIVAALALLTS